MPQTSQPAGDDLSPVSRRWLSAHSPESRKPLGQYLTPAPIAGALVDRLRLRPGMRVLDPGVGTGELLRAVADREPGALLTGWDVDRSALEAAADLVPEATLICRSALDPPDPPASTPVTAPGPPDSAPKPVPGGSGPDHPSGGANTPFDRAPGSYDLVIGNPPYFQFRPTAGQKERFGGVISGRANIFACFFKVGLDALKPGGRLAYIVPPSMNSGAYFEALREHLVERARILDLTVLDRSDRFEGANTSVQLLVLEKSPPSTEQVRETERSPVRSTADSGSANRLSVSERPFVFERSEPEAGFSRVIFTADPSRLARQFERRQTLWQLGYEASTGTVVWNQHRADLRRSPGPGRVALIWSHDLGSGGPPSPGSRPGKPGFVAGQEPRHGPAILVNRVVGAVGRGELRTAFLPEAEPYLAENHVNVIRPLSETRPGSAAPEIGWRELAAALADAGVADRVRLLTGNTQVSATELTHLLPLG